jgi:para-nitrobenzyl esterase
LAACDATGGGPKAPAEAAASAPSPVGGVWQLAEIRDPGGDVLVPDDPAKYTLALQDDGAAVIRADCNRGRGGYTIDGGEIGFGAIALTRAMCPPGSLDMRFVNALGQAVGWSIHEDRLHLDTAAGGSVLVFARGAPGA